MKRRTFIKTLSAVPLVASPLGLPQASLASNPTTPSREPRVLLSTEKLSRRAGESPVEVLVGTVWVPPPPMGSGYQAIASRTGVHPTYEGFVWHLNENRRRWSTGKETGMVVRWPPEDRAPHLLRWGHFTSGVAGTEGAATTAVRKYGTKCDELHVWFLPSKPATTAGELLELVHEVHGVVFTGVSYEEKRGDDPNVIGDMDAVRFVYDGCLTKTWAEVLMVARKTP